MREILFKGISTETGEWVEGDLDARLEDCTVIMSKSTCPTLRATSFSNHIVEPKTVCQFTGLLDSKGVRIFEGDMISGFCHGRNRHERAVGFENGFFNAGSPSYPLCDFIESKITGNIHDRGLKNGN